MPDDLGPVAAAPGAGREDTGLSEPEVLASIAAQAGLRRIHFVAWRDLDDPEAGGSELHAHEIASRWAAAGLDVDDDIAVGQHLLDGVLDLVGNGVRFDHSLTGRDRDHYVGEIPATGLSQAQTV